MSASKSFLEFAQRLQIRPRIPKKPNHFGPLPPANFEALSKVVHIPTKYENLFEQDDPARQTSTKATAQKSKQPSAEFKVKKLEPKAPRHKPKEDFAPSLKYQGKKIARIESTLREVLESRQLVRSLQIDTWRITSLTVNANERVCFVWWRLDESVEDPETQTTRITELLEAFTPAIQKSISTFLMQSERSYSAKRIPRIIFKRDIASEKQDKVIELLNKIEPDQN